MRTGVVVVVVACCVVRSFSSSFVYWQLYLHRKHAIIAISQELRVCGVYIQSTQAILVVRLLLSMCACMCVYVRRAALTFVVVEVE